MLIGTSQFVASTPVKAELRPIPGWPDYFASSDGRIYSNRPAYPSLSRVLHELTPVPTNGYLYVTVSGGLGRRKLGVHQAVAKAFIPMPEVESGVELVVRHRDNDKTNNAARNLLWGTQAQNLADRVEHGTMTWGERNGQAKLTADQVGEIRRRRAAGERCRDIARDFPITYQAVHKVASGQRWKCVNEPIAPRVRRPRKVSNGIAVLQSAGERESRDGLQEHHGRGPGGAQVGSADRRAAV